MGWVGSAVNAGSVEVIQHGAAELGYQGVDTAGRACRLDSAVMRGGSGSSSREGGAT